MKSNATTQIEHVAEGAVDQVSSILSDLRVGSLLLVADEAAYRGSGAEAVIEAAIAPFSVERFTQFQCNAKLPDVLRRIDHFQKNDVDAVLAIGGGSTLDIAKLISNLACKQNHPSGLSAVQCAWSMMVLR